MAAVRAIFNKQMNDLPKNYTGMGLFILWPVMAFVMGLSMDEVEASSAMFIGMIVGRGTLMSIANNIAEDNEYKGLRFLVMAGVKPWQYLLGLASTVMVASAASIAVLVFMGGFSGDVLIRLIIVSTLGIIASSILGGTVGIFAKNVQQSTAISAPLMLIFGLSPMFAGANETLGRIVEFLFPYQVLMVVLNSYTDFVRALIVLAVSIVVLLALFAVAYKTKGLRG